MRSEDFWPFFPVIFLGLWVFVPFIISRMGWHSFATRYPAPTRPRGNSYNSSGAWFGIFAAYRNVVRVVFTDAGIYCCVMLFFRPFHPPFLVPWQSLKRAEKKESFWGHRYRLDIHDPAGEFHLILPGKVENDLFKYFKAP